MRDKPGEKQGLRDFCRWIRERVEGPGSIIEIGSYAGDSAAIFLQYFASVTCVDPWSADPQYAESLTGNRSPKRWQQIERRFDRQAAGAAKIKATGDEAARRVGIYDVVYIDAVHTYEAVAHDIRTWLPHARLFIGGHDYGAPEHLGVKQAVDEVLGKPAAVFRDTSWVHAL